MYQSRNGMGDLLPNSPCFLVILIPRENRFPELHTLYAYLNFITLQKCILVLRIIPGASDQSYVLLYICANPVVFIIYLSVEINICCT